MHQEHKVDRDKTKEKRNPRSETRNKNMQYLFTLRGVRLRRRRRGLELETARLEENRNIKPFSAKPRNLVVNRGYI